MNVYEQVAEGHDTLRHGGYRGDLRLFLHPTSALDFSEHRKQVSGFGFDIAVDIPVHLDATMRPGDWALRGAGTHMTLAEGSSHPSIPGETSAERCHREHHQRLERSRGLVKNTDLIERLRHALQPFEGQSFADGDFEVAAGLAIRAAMPLESGVVRVARETSNPNEVSAYFNGSRVTIELGEPPKSFLSELKDL